MYLQRLLFRSSKARRAARLALALMGLPALPAVADQTIDLGTRRPSVEQVQSGLFPDDACEDLKAHGFKCMGFKPAVRFSLPAASFALGSSDLTPGIRRQLDVFAQALKGKAGAERTVRIEGHADISGSAAGNRTLSQRRAESARSYLVAQGVDAGVLKAVGVGSDDLLDSVHPRDARNRRVVIGRDRQPAGADPAAPGNDPAPAGSQAK